MIELIYTLTVTHITIMGVTLYLHRGQAHKGLDFSPVLSHFFRFWLWLTTGMVTKQWVAIHRKHHSVTDKDGDPHSPHVFGIGHVLFGGAFLYHEASKNSKLVANFGKGTPDDWLERNVYSKHSRLGISLMLLINAALFGWWGLLIWLVQIVWIPFWAAGVINGVGHWIGYRNHNTRDYSQNIFPWGIIVGGEELHNNHHQLPASPKLSHKAWEFDAGWVWINIFKNLKLLKITGPVP